MMLDMIHNLWYQTEIQTSFWSRYKDITRSYKPDKNKDGDEMVTEDLETEEISVAEINAWFQLQKYKPRCHDYYLNEDTNNTVDENPKLSIKFQ